MTRFIREGTEQQQSVLVAVDERKIRLLRSELGGDQENVEFVDMLALGRNPGRIISAWREFVAERGSARSGVRGVGEPVWPGRSQAELAECDRHESLLNLAFDGIRGLTLLCPYDTHALDDGVLEAARTNHPSITEHGQSRHSHVYADPRLACQALAGPLPPPPAVVDELGFGAAHLQSVRRFVWKRASDAGLDPQRQSDLVVAVNELATNSIRHGGGGGSLRAWRDQGSLICEVADAGSIEDPLVGRGRRDGQASGRGLWIVQQLCDLVQIRSEASSTRVRVRMDLFR